MKKPALAIALVTAALACAPARAQLHAPFAVATPAGAQAPAARAAGFYGGVALRDLDRPGTGVQGDLPLAFGTYGSPMADAAPHQTLFFGGYRFGNDVALEGSLSSTERYALQPGGNGVRRGIGLSLVPSETAGRTWNADLYTTWAVLPRFALYGRLGYAQTDTAGNPSLATLPPGDPRRGREGVNYGLGVRYDVNRALGLRLEYARFGHFAGETLQGGLLPDTDQLQLGVQLRF
jgi:opacity protein-like surface antigen